MKPGRELDKLVIEAMDWKWVDDCPLGDPHCPGHYETPKGDRRCCPPVSTEAAPAMIAWEWLEKNNPWNESLIMGRLHHQNGFDPFIGRYGTDHIIAWGETYPHAICLAILEVQSRTNS